MPFSIRYANHPNHWRRRLHRLPPVRHFVQKYPDYKIVNLDALTYAGNLENLRDVEHLPNYVFEKGDITDTVGLKDIFEKHRPDGVIHLAAESHVDRSISNPMAFVETNVMGTVNLLNTLRNLWGNDFENKRFYHVSTDEVYGSLGEEGFLRKKPATIRARLIRLPKLPAITLCGLIFTRTDCL